MSQDLQFDERPPRFARWLVEPMLENRATYIKVGIAAVLINLFGLMISLFSMTVYDRVVPNNATASLVGLAIGLAIVLVFDFVLRTLRAYFVDIAGMDVDRKVGESTFARLIALRLDLRRGSTGALAGLMRELEQLRDFLASASMVALIDVPFILLTLLVIALLGGWLVLVPLAMIPLVIGAGLLTYPALDRLAGSVLNNGLMKQTVLVETIGGLETVKVTGAGRLLSRRWLAATDEHADNSLRQRLVGTIGINVATTAQNLSYAGVVVFGVFLIAERQLTMGGMIACSLLSSRAVAPLATVAQLLSRLTATRSAYRQLNGFMSQPSEIPTGQPLRPAKIDGRIELRNVTFRYPMAKEDALSGVNLTINPGERVGIIGRVGSGKSTLARLILGLYQPTDGVTMIDGTDLRQMDIEAVRAKMGVAMQDSVLLSGSLRDNILLDRAGVDDEEMLRCARLTGVHDFVGQIANGYDLTLADRGESLSGGQRQSISLARALIGRPSLLVLDEPTSGMDMQSEEILMSRLATELADRTVVLITHRIQLLRLVNRVILVHGGKIAMDGPRDEVLKRLSQPQQAA